MCVNGCVFVPMYVSVCTHVCECGCVCMRMWVWVCVCVCVC